MSNGTDNCNFPTVNVRASLCNPGLPPPDITPDPDPEPERFPNVEQSVSCAGEEFLTVTDGPLPPYLSIVGNSLVMAAGHNSYTAAEGGQATADAAALAELQVFFDTGLISGLFLCGQYTNSVQTISCPDEATLSATGAIPGHFHIIGSALFIDLGIYSSPVSQAAADALALAALTTFYNDSIASGLLICESAIADPPPVLACGAWWKADSFSLPDGTPIGGPGNEWMDQSGNGRHAHQTDPNFQPLFRTGIFGTRPGIQFDGANDFLNIGATIVNALVFTSTQAPPSQACTIFILYQQALSDMSGMLLAEGTSACQVRSRLFDNDMWAWDGQGTVGDSAPFATVPGNPRVVVFQNQCFVSGTFFRENKTNIGPTNWSNLGFEFRKIGGGLSNYIGGPLIYYGGYIAEIIAYCARLTPAECDAIYDTYFRIRYPTLPP